MSEHKIGIQLDGCLIKSLNLQNHQLHFIILNDSVIFTLSLHRYNIKKLRNNNNNIVVKNY